MLSLLTVVLMFACTELGTRTFWKSQQNDPCRLNDPLLRYKYRPNCNAHLKIFEGPWIDHTYNDCGFRSKASCQARPVGSLRIAVLGSSFGQGYMAPYDQTFGGLLERDLTRSCRRQVQIQNLSAVAITTMDVYHRLDQALALKPDLVILTLAPHDLEFLNSDKDMAERDHPEPVNFGDYSGQKLSPLQRIRGLVKGSRTMEVAEHFLFENPETYVRFYLLYGDNADFLRKPLSPLWQRRFGQFDTLLGDMADKSRAQGVPLVWVAGLQRAQAQLMGSAAVPANIDPFAFEQQTAAIARRHGVIAIPVDNAFREVPNPGKLFYPVDGHLTPAGQQFFGQAIEKQLTAEKIPALSACVATDAPGSVPIAGLNPSIAPSAGSRSAAKRAAVSQSRAAIRPGAGREPGF